MLSPSLPSSLSLALSLSSFPSRSECLSILILASGCMCFTLPFCCPDLCPCGCQVIRPVSDYFYGAFIRTVTPHSLSGLSMHDLWSGCLAQTRLGVINGIIVQHSRGTAADHRTCFVYLFIYFSFFGLPFALSTFLWLSFSSPPLSLSVSPASSIEHFCLSKLCLQAENQCPWLDCLWAAYFAPGVNWLSNNDPEEGWSLSQGGFVYGWLAVVSDATLTLNFQIWRLWWRKLVFSHLLCEN